MAYAGGIGQEIDQLKDLTIEELVRRQKLDPSLIYTIALQERQKMDAAGARQGVLDEPKPQGTVTGRMEQELAQQTMPQSPVDRVAPGVMQQGQRSMQPRGPQMAQGPQTARGISGVPANNMGAIGRARGGIIEYADGGVVGYAPGGEVNMDALLDALMLAESGGDPDAVSSAGAEGAYQIMPSTAEQPGFGVPPMEGDRFDPEASRAFARQYLQAMIDRYDGDIEAGLIAYNAGAGNADKFIAANRDYEVLPQTMQTQPYVRKVIGQLEKEERRRDLQMGGGRTISTTAPESYTEKRRRERLEKQEAALASLYPPVAMEEAEMYEPNLPDALAVAQAMDSLSGGAEEVPVIAGFPTREETDKAFTDAGLSGYGDGSRIRQRARTGPEEVEEVEEESRELTFGGGRNITTTLPESFTEQSTRERREANAPAEGIAGYLQNIGRQQQLRRDDFRRAVPGAEAAVARAEQEKEDGGIGYLRRLGRLQERAAQRQAEEAERAAKFMAMLQQNEDMIADIDPAGKGTGQAYTQQTMPIQKFEKGGSPNSYGGGGMGGLGEYAEMAVNWATENPVDALATGLMFIPGIGWGAAAGAKGVALTAKVAGPILKKYGTTAGQKIIQGIKTLGTKATTRPNPNPAAIPRAGNKPGQVRNGRVQPTQSVRGPDGRMQAGPPGRVVDPLRIAGGTGVAIKAGDALFNGEDEATGPTNAVEYLQDIGRKQEEAGTIEAFREKRRAEEAAQRNRPLVKTGIAGALDKAKPLGGLALKLAEVLGRGAGASEGFEGAKILEESSRLRSEEAKMQLNRDQIAATTGQSAARSAATANTALMKLITEYRDGSAYRIDLAAKAEELNLEETDPQVIKAVMDAYIDNLKNVQGMLGGGIGSMQGLGGGGGLSADQRANLQAFIAS